MPAPRLLARVAGTVSPPQSTRRGYGVSGVFAPSPCDPWAASAVLPRNCDRGGIWPRVRAQPAQERPWPPWRSPLYRPTADLAPYAANARTHSPEQVAALAPGLREFGWTNPVLVDGANGIIA